MAAIVFLLWLLIIIVVPIGFVAAAILGFRADPDSSFSSFATGLGIFVHLVAIAASSIPIFVIVWGAGHRDPPIAFSISPIEAAGLLMELMYLILALSYCSVIAGRKRPWPLKVPTN